MSVETDELAKAQRKIKRLKRELRMTNICLAICGVISFLTLLIR